MSEVNVNNISKLQTRKISELSNLLEIDKENITPNFKTKLMVPESLTIIIANEYKQGEKLLKGNYKIKLSDIFENIKAWVRKQIITTNITKKSNYITLDKTVNEEDLENKTTNYEFGLTIADLPENITDINSVSTGLVDSVLLKKTHTILDEKIDKTKTDIESNLVNTNVYTSIPNNFVEVEKITENKDVNYNIKLDIIENVDDNKNGLITKNQVVDLLNKDKWNII